MKRDLYFLVIGLACIITGCSHSAGSDSYSISNSTKSEKFLKGMKQYASLIDNTHPILCMWDLPNTPTHHQSNYTITQKNFGRNTVYLDEMSPISINYEDSFQILSEETPYTIQLFHKSRLLNHSSISTGSDTIASIENDTTITIQYNVEPIRIIQPYIEDCNDIPFCWYRDMDIAWNADLSNENGVIIVTAWTGVVVGTATSSNTQSVYHIDLVEDNGYTTLDNNLFNGMPENALVTLIVLRANIVKVEIDNEQVLRNPDEINSGSHEIGNFIDQFIYKNWETLHQAYTIALGSVDYIHFILIRNSYLGI